MKKIFLRIVLPWFITLVALYYAFKGIDFSDLLTHIRSANPGYLAAAFLMTFISYFLRAFRWRFFFESKCMDYLDSLKVLFLGFFMNNVLPARAGEFVRAHLGAKVAKQTRTLVLATVASERLSDGLTISALFAIFCIGMGDKGLSKNLSYVAIAFAVATLGVVIVLLCRNFIFKITDKIKAKKDGKAITYTLDRLEIFIRGLSPLFKPSNLPYIVLSSLLIWFVEVSVYYLISLTFHTPLTLPYCILFLVAVNFSSLIPAAPGGIGVIEAVGSAVLVSVGVEKEHALSMVIAQHAVQYITVAIPGAYVMLTWKSRVKEAENEAGNQLTV